jgi:hypothetical protein
MPRPATYDDANLLLKLYEMRRETVMRDARRWFAAEFKAKTLEEWKKACPVGSQMNAWYRQMVTYWEMASTMVTSGVLHEDLFAANSLEALMVFIKVEPMLPELRAFYKNPGYLKNLEAAAGIVKRYLDQQGPEAYEAFVGRWR